MTFELLEAKNGQKTVKINAVYLHSSYNPEIEAERFSNSIKLTFNSQKIIIIEPGLGYCFPYLKKRFPDIKIGCINFINNINKTYKFDFEINIFDKKNIQNILNLHLSEEDYFSTLFLTWPASEKIFTEENTVLWNSINENTKKAKTLLITREYFEKRWFLNSIKYLSFVNKTVSFKKTINLPIAICASGPSLKSCLNIIKNNSNKFFIICLSSALSVLQKNNILPDMVLSTDGGYWAGEHLKKLGNIPLGLPLEAKIKTNLLNTSNIIPFVYDDGLSAKIAKLSSIEFYSLQRNGTVSGSAIDFALENSSGDIYFFGLDLSSQNGFQHTQPNELELNNSLNDNRIKTKEKRIYPGSLKNDSLTIYENWFKNKKLTNRTVFRVIDSEFKKNALGQIQDLNSYEFKKLINQYSNNNNKDFFEIKNISNVKNKSLILNCIKTYFNDENILKTIFPLSFILLSHLEESSEEYNNQMQKIKKQTQDLIEKAGKILNE